MLERVSICMRRKCVVVARCTTAQAECLRGGACARIFGFVHPCTVLLGFLIILGGGGRSLRNFEICFARQFLCPESTVLLGGSSFSSLSSSHARNTRNTQRTKSKQMQTKMQPEFRMPGHEDTSMITNVVSCVSCVSCVLCVLCLFHCFKLKQNKSCIHNQQ